MSHENIRAFRAYAASKGMSPGQALRLLASSTGDVQDKLLKLLQLDPSSDIDAILAAVKAAFDAGDAPDGTAPDAGGAAETADPQIPMHVGATQSGRGTKQLSAWEQDRIKTLGLSPSQFAAAKRGAVRRA